MYTHHLHTSWYNPYTSKIQRLGLIEKTIMVTEEQRWNLSLINKTKNDTFSGSVVGDWNVQSNQWNILSCEYNEETKTRVNIFRNSLQHILQAYNNYQWLKKMMNCRAQWYDNTSRIDFTRIPKNVFQSQNKKKMNFQRYRKEAKSDDQGFEKVLTEIELLSCLEQENDQTDIMFCDVLWKGSEVIRSLLWN